MYRQGDILLIKKECSPKGTLSKEDVLIEVSMTGHAHKVKNGQIYHQEIERSTSIFAYIVALKGCKLIHDEHKTIELPEGVYEARRQREVSGYVYD